jgi:hypothetical protein
VKNQTFTIVVLFLSPNPLLFFVIVVYFIEQQTSFPSPLFLISIIYWSVLQGCYNGLFLPHSSPSPLRAYFWAFVVSPKLTPLYLAR